jgi:diguanylate cyclase (GGDEF)-like protein
VSFLSTLDLRTILACQLLLSTAFAIVFFAMKWAYRQLHGIGCIATGFLLSAPGVLLVAMRGSISDFASIVLAYALILSAYLYFYLGILRFFTGRRWPNPLGIWSATASVVIAVFLIAWFALYQPNTVARMVANSIPSAYICILISMELYRRATDRRAVRIFSLFMFLPAAYSLYRVYHAIRFGLPAQFLQSDGSHASALAVNVIFTCILGIFFQLMIASELTLAIEHRARHDLLTGTLNRHGIEQRLSGELDRANRNGHPLSALLIDVDQFKSINDNHGHAVGDQALRSVAQSIAASLRSYDLLGRYGGDEFLLLLPETHSRHALEVAERIRAIVNTAHHHNDQLPHHPTISIGVTEILPLDTPITFLARADAALYDAKHAGRNCTRIRHASGMHPVAPSQSGVRTAY